MKTIELGRRGQAVTSVLLAVVLPGCGDGAATKQTPKTESAPQSASPPVLATPAGLPDDPASWVCHSEPIEPTQVEQWCKAHPERGKPADLPGGPEPLSKLAAKNEYDEQMSAFLNEERYAELGWVHDQRWRLTGPCVGEIDERCEESYGVHPAVRVWYSPEVVDWLCNDRQGEIPDGAVVIKEMHGLDSSLDITVDSQGCMDIGASEVKASSWTLMIKSSAASRDGWYWAGIGRDSPGNPPIVDASAFVDPKAVPKDPTAPEPTWLPTGDLFGAAVAGGPKVANVVYPYNMFGNYCVNCHASAVSESTYSTLGNVIGPGLRYKWFADPTEEDPDAAVVASGSRHDAKDDAVVQGAAPSVYQDPFTPARSEPDGAFLAFFDQLAEVSYAEVWKLRLPAETYDHVVAGPEGPAQFITSDQCAGCHDATASNAATPNMDLTLADGTRVDLSPYGEWRVSPMGLAGRDPIFFSQLQSETNNLPELEECIETTCLHCHGVMGQRQLGIDTAKPDARCKELFGVPPPAELPFGDPFRLDMVTQWPESPDNAEQRYGALARDGISCTVCHHMGDQQLGEVATFTGNFVTGPADELFGPFERVVTKPMEHALGITPKQAPQITSSDMCGSCHAILLPKITNAGTVKGYSFEQTTFLEWQNSDTGRPGDAYRSCQDCHMPHRFGDRDLAFEIANIESADFPPTDNRLPDDQIRLTSRTEYRRHALHGVNVFLNEMFQQFPLVLGMRQLDYMTGSSIQPPLITGQQSMLELARSETAAVTVGAVKRESKTNITVEVTVTNHSGHFTPSGVGFRRAFLEVVALDASGTPRWASGRTNELGVIVEGVGSTPLNSELRVDYPRDYQPHYTEITSQDQVQIYEEVVADSAGNISTSFLRRMKTLKDNRLRPKGFDPQQYATSSSPFIQALAYECPSGDRHDEKVQTCLDLDYADPTRTGQDRLSYVITADAATLAEITEIRVTLYYQSIPPTYLQERFRDASRGPADKDEIQRLHYLTSHLDTEAKDVDGEAFIEHWKLEIASGSATVPPATTP